MQPGKRKLIKTFFVIFGLIAIIAISLGVYYYYEKFDDTSTQTADYTLTDLELLNAFRSDKANFNTKYAEKIITVKGMISEIEKADTTVNVKFIDSLSGDYIIFAFQEQHIDDALTLKEGENIAIKGSCSGGAYSEILETHYITFKRCAIINK